MTDRLTSPPHWAGSRISPNRTRRGGEEFNFQPIAKPIPFDHLIVSNFTATPITASRWIQASFLYKNMLQTSSSLMQQVNFIDVFLARHVSGTYAHHQER